MLSLALVLACQAQDFEPFPPSPFDRVIRITLDEHDGVLPGQGPAERVTYVAQFAGTLHVWTRTEGDPDLSLRIEKSTGQLAAEDDDSGGGQTPYLRIEVEPGLGLQFLVALSPPTMSGAASSPRVEFDLCLIAAPETAECRTAADAARRELAELHGLWKGGDLVESRRRLEAAAAAFFRLPAVTHSELIAAVASEFGAAARAMSVLQPEKLARTHALKHRMRTLPGQHGDLQVARMALAVTLKELGDLQASRQQYARALEVFSKTLPEEHHDLQAARLSLASVMSALGDLKGARPLLQRAVDVLSRTLPEGHTTLQAARQNLGVTLGQLGELAAARSEFERVLEVCSRTLPEGHPDLQLARQSLAWAIVQIGDLEGARALQEQVLGDYSRTLPEEHPKLQRARMALADTLAQLGEVAHARRLLERAVEVFSRTLPVDHPDLQRARGGLALALYQLGEIDAARWLLTRVLEVLARTMPEDHHDLQRARLALADTLRGLGDLTGARALEESALGVLSRTHPEDHPDLQRSRLGLAMTLSQQGDHVGARSLQALALESLSHTLPADHPTVQQARLSLGSTLAKTGDLAGARALQEQALEVCTRTLPRDNQLVLEAQSNLASTLWDLNDLPGARVLQERVLETVERTLPEGNRNIQVARLLLARTLLDLSASLAKGPGGAGGFHGGLPDGFERAVSLLRSIDEAEIRIARELHVGSPGREAEERCARMSEFTGFSLSVSLGYGGFGPEDSLQHETFALSEATRNASIPSSVIARLASGSKEYPEARRRLRRATAELARIVQAQAVSSEEFRVACVEREAAELALLALSQKLAGGRGAGLVLDAARLSDALEPGDAVIAYRVYKRFGPRLPERPSADAAFVSSPERTTNLCAFVVRPRPASSATGAEDPLSLLDLGPIEGIRLAVDAWRQTVRVDHPRGSAVGGFETERVRSTGEDLRRLLLDPLLPHLGGARHLILVPDDVLHLVPIDSLPFTTSDPATHPDDANRSSTHSWTGARLLGDHYRIELRATLGELLDPASPLTGQNTLLALGGISFFSEPAALEAEDLVALETAPQSEGKVVDHLRGTNWERGFDPLPYSALEAQGIKALFTELFAEGGEALLLEKRKASREALQTLAPRARWLHIATHGWLAPPSILSWEGASALDDKAGLVLRADAEQTVRGMSPMLLCGLALAGANLPEDAVGRVPGLVTADEMSSLDLTNCELAVLSACDTARGEMRRAGQGVASLQKALQVAGARSVITSLWKVPDEATKELMLDFYRRVWFEKQPKWQALWEAKARLREARDESGKPKYAVRDWAAWVLTGEPD